MSALETSIYPGRCPNSYRAKVLPFVAMGVPKDLIERETGIHGNTLTDAIRGARKYTEGLTPEEQVLMHRVNTSAKRGGILTLVSEYFPLDLTSRQTQIALAVDHGVILEQEKIANTYGREVRRHNLQRPIKELTIEAQRDKRRSKQELLDIVKRRQYTRKLIEEEGLPKPQNLTEWSLQESCIFTITEKLKQLLNSENLIPKDMLGRKYLLALYEARRAWIEDKDRSLITNFPSMFESQEPQIAVRLKSQIQILIQGIKPRV